MFGARIKKAIIPDGINYLGSNLFLDCISLTEIVCLSETPPFLAGLALNYSQFNAGGCKIYVPAASLEIYKNHTGWTVYSNLIYPI